MDNNLSSVRGYINYCSKEKVKNEPKIFSTGGYRVLDEKNQEILFDFNLSESGCEILEDGRLKIDVSLREFDADFFEESNKSIEELDKITPELLASFKLLEVYYECFADDNEEEFIELEVVDFCIEDVKKGKDYFFDVSEIEK